MQVKDFKVLIFSLLIKQLQHNKINHPFEWIKSIFFLRYIYWHSKFISNSSTSKKKKYYQKEDTSNNLSSIRAHAKTTRIERNNIRTLPRGDSLVRGNLPREQHPSQESIVTPPWKVEKVPREGSLVALEESGGRHFRGRHLDAFYKETFFTNVVETRFVRFRSLFAPFARIGGPIPFPREYFTPELSTSSLWYPSAPRIIFIYSIARFVFRIELHEMREISSSGGFLSW